MKASLTRAVLLYALLAPCSPAVAWAQGRVDRSPLDFPVRGTPKPPTDSGITFMAAPEQKPVDTLFSWFLNPSAVLADQSDSYGLALGVVNKALVPGLPLALALTDRYVTAPGGDHNRVQFDAKLLFEGLPPLGTKGLSLLLIGQYRNTAQVASLQQGIAELDATLYQNKVDSTSFALGGVAYYGHQKPAGGIGSSGFTFGVVADVVPVRHLELIGEYDFKSDFAGEDDYSVQAGYAFHPRGLQCLVGIAEYGKHGTWKIGLKVGFVGPTRLRKT